MRVRGGDWSASVTVRMPGRAVVEGRTLERGGCGKLSVFGIVLSLSW